MPQKVKHVSCKEGYNLYADFYDKRLKYLDSFEEYKLLPLAGDIAGKNVLDAGAGTGRLGVKLADMGAKVTALDISPEILKKIERKNKSIKTAVGDACAMPFADKTFDIVVAAFLIVHIDNPLVFFRETWRVLKPGGKFIVTNVNQKRPPKLKTKNGLVTIESYYHRPQKIEEMLIECNFDIKKNFFIKQKETWINQIVLAEK